MALDHSSLGLENKSGRFFCVRQVYFTKSCQQIWGCVNQPLYFLCITYDVKQYYEALYLSYRPRTECSISQFFKTNFTQSIFRPFNRGLLAKPFKKVPKSAIPSAGSHFWCELSVWSSVWMNFNRVTLQHNNEFIIFIFCYLMVSVITMSNVIKRLICATFLSTSASDVHERWKQTPRTSD